MSLVSSVKCPTCPWVHDAVLFLGEVRYLSLVYDALLALVAGHVVLREAVGPMVKRLIGCRVQGSGVKLH